MFKRVLVPLDGSERAERALPVALRLVALADGSILLVRVVTASAYLPTAYDLPDGTFAPADEAEVYLKTVAARPELAAFPVQTRVVTGTPAVEILDAAHENGADAIVLCSHGRTGLARWAMGSVAQKIGRHAAMPVLVLKEGASLPAPLTTEPARDLRVLLPLDGSPLAEAAIAPALALIAGLAASGSVRVQLLRVVDLTTIYGRVGIDSDQDTTLRTVIMKSAQEYLSALAEQLRGQLAASRVGGTVSWSVATGVDPAAIIANTAEGHAGGASGEAAGAFDLIAMATHGRGGLGVWAVGSVTERVLSTCALPLLIVRPPLLRGHAEVIATVRQEPGSLTQH